MARKTTHVTSIAALKMRTRQRIVRLLNIDVEVYMELHYEMAATWLNIRGYCNEVARMMMVSKTFHRWWDMQLMQREIVYLHNYSDKATLGRYIGFMVIIPNNPSDVLVHQISDEALLAFSRKSNLKKMVV